jgi:hypothetical protein
MANQLYPSFKEALLRAFLLGEGFANPVEVMVTLVGPAYEFDESHRTDADLSDVIGTPIEIPGIAVSAAAVVDGGDLIPAFTGLAISTTVSGLVVYARDSVTLESQLIGFIDTATNGSLPAAIALPDLNLRWPPTGIFGI